MAQRGRVVQSRGADDRPAAGGAAEELRGQAGEAQAGADAAAADYQQALNTLEQIYKIEKQNRAEEAAAAAASEAARQKELEMANQAANASSSAVSSSTQSRSSQTIVLQGPSGTQTSVQTSDPDALLKILEDSGLRSA